MGLFCQSMRDQWWGVGGGGREGLSISPQMMKIDWTSSMHVLLIIALWSPLDKHWCYIWLHHINQIFLLCRNKQFFLISQNKYMYYFVNLVNLVSRYFLHSNSKYLIFYRTTCWWQGVETARCESSTVPQDSWHSPCRVIRAQWII